ncbi:MAG: pseudouridine synthase, partial [Bacteroidota bacterium]
RTYSKPSVSEEPKVDDGTIRLNKYISNAGICSRREADDLIGAGVISVNGEVVTTLGFKVQPGDVVKYNDAKLKSEKPVYLLLNKPKDYITTVDDPQNRQTVMSLIKHACKERVYPVGRLDRNTTGLLLFTNDGDLADKLTHPSFEVQKVYEVHLDKNLRNEHFEEIGNGLMLEDGVIKPDEISYSPDDKSIIGIELHSGRNRIVRRIFEHFGYRISKLDRVLYAGLTKKDLPRSKFRFLTELELANLKMMTGNKRFKSVPKRIVLQEE